MLFKIKHAFFHSLGLICPKLLEREVLVYLIQAHSLSNTFWENKFLCPCLQGENNALWQWDTGKKHRDCTLLLCVENIVSVMTVHRKFECTIKYSRPEKKKKRGQGKMREP